jgi:hypothetical protein
MYFKRSCGAANRWRRRSLLTWSSHRKFRWTRPELTTQTSQFHNCSLHDWSPPEFPAIRLGIRNLYLATPQVPSINIRSLTTLRSPASRFHVHSPLIDPAWLSLYAHSDPPHLDIIFMRLGFVSPGFPADSQQVGGRRMRSGIGGDPRIVFPALLLNVHLYFLFGCVTQWILSLWLPPLEFVRFKLGSWLIDIAEMCLGGCD